MMQELDFVDTFRAYVAANDTSIERVAEFKFQEHEPGDMFVSATCPTPITPRHLRRALILSIA